MSNEEAEMSKISAQNPLGEHIHINTQRGGTVGEVKVSCLFHDL